jgi:hypothetical protein
MPILVRYHFSQHFAVSAQKAFDWCTTFDSADHKLMGDSNAQRQIAHIAEGTIILNDTFHSSAGTIEKQKLVELYPDQHTWTSTHLTGPNQYSQFLYKISPVGKGISNLKFTGLHLEYNEKTDAKLLAKKLCKEDSYVWSLLAKAMIEELEE